MHQVPVGTGHLLRLMGVVCLVLLFTMSTLEVQAQPAPPTHTVQVGDTLAAIAARYGTTVETLVVLNHLDATSYI